VPLCSRRALVDRPVPSIIRGVEAPLVFISTPSVPAGNLAEFIKWAKENKGKLSYSSYQAGTPSHFLGFQMNEKWNLDLTHVPYRGSGLQVTGLLGGHSQFGFTQVNSSLPHVRAGKLNALATTGPARDRSMPDVPTFAELGYPEFTAKVWFGLHRSEGRAFSRYRSRRREGGPEPRADPASEQARTRGFDVSGATGPHDSRPTSRSDCARAGPVVLNIQLRQNRGSTLRLCAAHDLADHRAGLSGRVVALRAT
jgi:hypothetical protein